MGVAVEDAATNLTLTVFTFISTFLGFWGSLKAFGLANTHLLSSRSRINSKGFNVTVNLPFDILGGMFP